LIKGPSIEPVTIVVINDSTNTNSGAEEMAFIQQVPSD
jgi:hypothetical protein